MNFRGLSSAADENALPHEVRKKGLTLNFSPSRLEIMRVANRL
jgi:hypothetical protein